MTQLEQQGLTNEPVLIWCFSTLTTHSTFFYAFCQTLTHWWTKHGVSPRYLMDTRGWNHQVKHHLLCHVSHSHPTKEPQITVFLLWINNFYFCSIASCSLLLTCKKKKHFWSGLIVDMKGVHKLLTQWEHVCLKNWSLIKTISFHWNKKIAKRPNRKGMTFIHFHVLSRLFYYLLIKVK